MVNSALDGGETILFSVIINILRQEWKMSAFQMSLVFASKFVGGLLGIWLLLILSVYSSGSSAIKVWKD